ncbi:hypothetical protein [Variovorax sp. PCZ-1]|uniref:hypothetical protein n=1 Tax=Variovorax sp. PCZ-1 TaxID=2835533 RepID=UPI001BCFDA17|nr:hypothetical protein [Variovorax sp. PCZ-1]MBS7808034.1 hypothetical protein [Variovorax sp. PCZ-1]
MRTLLTWTLAAGLATASTAATRSDSFSVNIQLRELASSICVSTSLSQQTNALVRVTCQGNQFVSIEQNVARPFVGTHGGAYRFAFSGIGTVPAGLLHPGELDHWVGQGTITALRVLNLTERDERLELLVSF